MIEFKDDYAREGWPLIHPLVRSIAKEANYWSEEYDKKSLVITESLSTPERDKALRRESPAHSQGRAVDIRTIDMPKEKKIKLMDYLNGKYLACGYIPNKGGARRLMYEHDNGNGTHIHLAIGIDIVEKVKSQYPDWKYPVYKKKGKVKNESL